MSESEKKTVVKTIAATKARIRFGDILKRVHSGREQFIVEKDGLEVAAILGRQDYEQYRRLLALHELETLNKAVNREMQSRGITEEQALSELRGTSSQVVAERYGHLKSRRHAA